MKLVKILPFSLCLLACVAGAQQSSLPNDKTDVYLQNDKPKNQKDSNTRTIQGTVKDASDNPLSGSIVQLKDMKTSKIVDFITKDDGKYAFSDLPMDINYELAATRGDLKAAAKKVSVYDTRKTVILNFQVAAAKP
jgi:Carboxypeptidase regulatory-like domain